MIGYHPKSSKDDPIPSFYPTFNGLDYKVDTVKYNQHHKLEVGQYKGKNPRDSIDFFTFPLKCLVISFL